MLTPFREIIRDAHRRHYAVGAFNCLSVENVMGAIAAAEELHAPLILQLAEVQFPGAPMELMAPVFLQAARSAKVPVAVHLDHGQSPETCIRAIRAGFNSVMFDGAGLPLEEASAAKARAMPPRPTSSPMSGSRHDSSPKRASTPWPSPSATYTAAISPHHASTSAGCAKSTHATAFRSSCTAAAARAKRISNPASATASAKSMWPPRCSSRPWTKHAATSPAMPHRTTST